MCDVNDEKGYRTLRAALTSSEEPAEPIYFAYSATLRIFGRIPDLDELTRHLGVSPSDSHRQGERRRPESAPYQHDMWSYDAPLNESEPLHVHIDSLWSVFRERKEYLLQIKQNLSIDVFFGYRSNCDQAGVEIPHRSLEMFLQLEVPIGVSIIIT
jgi:hypothetical protein